MLTSSHLQLPYSIILVLSGSSRVCVNNIHVFVCRCFVHFKLRFHSFLLSENVCKIDIHRDVVSFVPNSLARLVPLFRLCDPIGAGHEIGKMSASTRALRWPRLYLVFRIPNHSL